ncbi:LytR family transcriptional regulator [Agaribacter marinus]|uniref:Regulatory protein MsrR n=1 Tax=Virgibacillus salarius TaxID=447199 RepID=A0A941DT78_9BACI|nr:LCP family protein [Virgibacillus salarius]MBR7796265.1 LCP family protein [Virgibacillus salarius]NAZ08973.1 LytR family transcriptional regulator [Agaribacter marinus]
MKVRNLGKVANNQVKRKKLRKKRNRKLILSITLLTTMIIIYCVYQYNQGLSMNKGVANTTVEPFEGEEVQFGEIKVLLIGTDAREEEKGRSDTLMIGYYNQHTHQIKIVSLMRDTYVEIPGYGMQKLNAAYSFGGPELLRKTIKHNFDININYYATVDFNGFPKIIDLVAPDGIKVNIEKEMSKGIGMTLHPGEQILHGDQLLGYVRFRKDSQNDFGRVERQQEVLSKLKDQALRINQLVKLPKILGATNAYIDTNVNTQILYSIGKGLLTHSNEGVETLRIPTENSYTNLHVDAGAVLNIDLEKNKQALKAFLESDYK